MPPSKYSFSETKYKKWLKEGRGAGKGGAYKPWLTVRDVPSDGRSHRIFGHKSQRIHHLLSDLEAAVFLLLEWRNDVTDIREQFPLDREVTKRIATDFSVKHPSEKGVQLFMSSDFLVNTTQKEPIKFAIQAKYVDAISDPRTLEKLEIERRFWKEKEVPWYLITELEIPKTVLLNIRWLYPAASIEIDDDILLNRLDFYRYQFDANPQLRIIEICKKLDTAYNLDLGESLLEVRQLLSKRFFQFDIFIPTTKLKASDIKPGNLLQIEEALRVSNQ